MPRAARTAAAVVVITFKIVVTTAGCDGAPASCSTEGPLESSECGAYLAEQCGDQSSEDDCLGVETIRIDDTLIDTYCVWVDVVAFEDAAACTFAAVSQRCIAAYDDTGDDDGCTPACAYGATDGDFVLLESGELMTQACGRSGGGAIAPIDGETALASREPHLPPCALPDAPAACACVKQACAALSTF